MNTLQVSILSIALLLGCGCEKQSQPVDNKPITPVPTDKHSLSRPEALNVLNQRLGKLRGTVHCYLWSLVNLPGTNALLSNTKLRILSEKGYVSVSDETHMLPTAKGRDWTDTSGGDRSAVMYVPVALPVATAVNGISPDGPGAVVEFSWKWVDNPDLAELAAAGFSVPFPRQEQSGSLPLRLYDDGWRVPYPFEFQNRTFESASTKMIVFDQNCE